MKERIDKLLVQNGFFDTRERAKVELMAGNVFVNGQRIDKAGMLVKDDSKIEVRGQQLKYVGRGGLKLEKAIDYFNIELNNFICMDIGASTGGFTDCMLQNNAKKVFSVDVGVGQLDYKLQKDERVIDLSKTDARNLNFDLITEKIDFFTMDVAFISTKKIIPNILQFLNVNSKGVILVKPQFETSPQKVEKGGIVRKYETHIEVLEDILFSYRNQGLNILGVIYSPIQGRKGNIEYLVYVEFSENIEYTDDELLKIINTLVYEREKYFNS